MNKERRAMTNNFPLLLDAIGNTPLVKLDKIARNFKANIFAKLEFMNPGAALKTALPAT